MDKPKPIAILSKKSGTAGEIQSFAGMEVSTGAIGIVGEDKVGEERLPSGWNGVREASPEIAPGVNRALMPPKAEGINPQAAKARVKKSGSFCQKFG